MADRNSIVEKIKALLSKTVENGCTEAEMLSALGKASAMRDAYDISDEELQITKEEAAILHADPDPKDPHGIKWRLSYAIGEFCGVKTFRKTHEGGLRCIGLPSDVQFATWLMDSLADFVFGELMAHLIGCVAPQSERRVIIRSFTAACCDRISNRLLELVERSKTARTSNGRELVIVKDAAIKQFMKSTASACACAAGIRHRMLTLPLWQRVELLVIAHRLVGLSLAQPAFSGSANHECAPKTAGPATIRIP